MYHNVFVYGTLKGMDKSARRSPTRFIGRGRTRDGNFLMWGGGFPCIKRLHGFGEELDNGHVKGELYVVDDNTLQALDAYEGAPDFYKAEEVEVVLEDGTESKALIYVGTGVLESVSRRPAIKPDSSGELYWPYSSEHKEDYSHDTTEV